MFDLNTSQQHAIIIKPAYSSEMLVHCYQPTQYTCQKTVIFFVTPWHKFRHTSKLSPHKRRVYWGKRSQFIFRGVLGGMFCTVPVKCTCNTLMQTTPVLCDFRLPSRCTWDLRFYAASSGNPISMFRANLSDPSSRVSVEWFYMPTCRNLSVEMGLTGCPETSVWNYHATPREIPDKSGF